MAEFSLNESQLVNKSERTLADGVHKDALERVRLLCLGRGATGVISLGRAFRNMHDGGSKVLNYDEFSNAMVKSGLDCTEDEIKELFEEFDTHNEGSIYVTEFLSALRPPLSDGRKAIIDKAFEKIKKSEEGVVTVNDLRKSYSVKYHPSYFRGDLTEKEILDEFLAHFIDRGSTTDTVTKDEFVHYYSIVSAAIDDDGFFDLMMRQCYRL